MKDTKKLQAYLNNATLKVTTKALGNNKIRVNARFDAETYKDIVAECGNDYTISYKFYQKSAKATSFKGPKEKSRNYITYTKASLKKGTKYKFQCGVVIKDAQGNVVAEKSYRGFHYRFQNLQIVETQKFKQTDQIKTSQGFSEGGLCIKAILLAEHGNVPRRKSRFLFYVRGCGRRLRLPAAWSLSQLAGRSGKQDAPPALPETG